MDLRLPGAENRNRLVAAALFQNNVGYVTRSGKCGIPFRYEWAGDFSDGLAPVQINGKCGFINATVKTVILYICVSPYVFAES